MSGLNTDIQFLSPWLAKKKNTGSVIIAEADTEASLDPVGARTTMTQTV
jgi:hypothetical protein